MTNKRIFLVIILMVFLSVVFKFANASGANESNYQTTPSMDQFAERYKVVSAAMAPLEKAKQDRNNGNYEAAEFNIRESLDQYKKLNMDEWLPRYYLQEILELQGKNAESIKELDWLMGHTKNEKTIKKMQLKRLKLASQPNADEQGADRK